MAAVVRRAFLGSYLRDLRSIDSVHGAKLLSTCYLGRAHDRLLHFISAVASRGVNADLGRVIKSLSTGEDIVVNDRVYSNTLAVLSGLEADETSRSLLAPRVVGPCAHGDLTILNMVLTKRGGLALIDPRGFTGMWDPIYDLSKLAFSVSGFAACLTSTLRFVWKGSQFRTVVDRPAEAMSRARKWLDQWLLADEAFGPLRSMEPWLKWRLRLGEASHYLADVTYRYAQGQDSNSALTVLLLGVTRLGDLVDDLRAVCKAPHQAL